VNVLYTKTASGSIDEVATRLEKAVANHQFGILGVINLNEKMAAKGVILAPQCRVFEVCNPHKAKQVLDKNMAISTALPCRIAVYEEGGDLMVATISPSAMLSMFNVPELAPAAG